MRIAYFDCFSGISGDMTIGAFLDAGLNFRTLSKELSKLGLGGYRLRKSKTERNGIAGTKFDCAAKAAPRSRSLKNILSLIGRSRLSARAKNIASSIFANIGQAEAKIHAIGPKRDIHLHELGSVDSIIDIAGAAIAIDELGIGEVHSSAVSMGRGFVDTAHGLLPAPSPASLEILKGAPVEIAEIGAELVTPTGAGILKTLAKSFGRMPRMKIERIGYGAGSRELAGRPNMLRIAIGQREAAFAEDRVAIIETNIDDMSPQNFGYLFEKLLGEGALDLYTTAVQMKKSRPGILLTVLARPADSGRISSVVFTETTSTGLRIHEADRLKLERRFIKVRTKYGEVPVKLAGEPGASGALTASPEYDACVKIARSRNVPLKVVFDEAKKAALK